MGNRDRAITIGDDRINIDIGPFVINLDHFSRIGIVIHCHFCVADHRYATNFARMKPADMNMRGHPVSIPEIKMGNIMIARSEMGMRLHFNLFRFFVKEVKQDRNIVRGKIPNNIDIITIQPQIDSFCLDAIDFSQISTLDHFAQFIDGRAIKKGMSHCQNALLLICQSYQFFCLSYTCRQRFLNKYMFAVEQRLFRELVVCAYRSSNDYCINI